MSGNTVAGAVEPSQSSDIDKRLARLAATIFFFLFVRPATELGGSAARLREMAGRKRKQISLSDKLSIINAVDNGEKQADIARRMGLSKQTVNSILKNKDVAEKRDSGEIQEKRFRMRKAAHPDVESGLLMWLRDARARGIPVNGLLLRSRAPSPTSSVLMMASSTANK